MRRYLHWLASVPLALAIAWPASAQPPQPSGPPMPRWLEVTPPEVVCRAALADLQRLPQADRPYTRYVSWHGVPAAKLADWSGPLWRWWVNQLSTGPVYVPPRQVTPWLQAVDMRDYRWNAAAWSAVARRDVLFRAPLVSDLTGDSLRQLIGVQQDPKTLHVEAVVWGPRLFRDSIETNRAPTYYDLLFAGQRFRGGKVGYTAPAKPVEAPAGDLREVTVDHPGGPLDLGDSRGVVNVGPGRYVVKRRGGAAPAPAAHPVENGAVEFVDFPRTIDEANEFFGVKSSTDFAKQQRIQLQSGAVVAGSSDDPVRGSIVSRNNRVVEITPVLRQEGNAVATRTYDVFRTSGNKDFSERHTQIVQGDIDFDAGEALFPLFNGGQFGMLFDAKGKRLEKAVLDAAHNRKDPVYGDVRTMMGCVGCHQTDDGFITPRDLTTEQLRAGVDLYVKDRDLRNRIKAYFLNWNRQVVGWRSPYASLRYEATRNPADPADKGWTAAKLDLEFHALRNWYDAPVSPEQAAQEVGMPSPFLKVMVSVSRRQRLNMLAQGVPAPRNVWDDDLVPEVSARIALLRDGKSEYNERGR